MIKEVKVTGGKVKPSEEIKPSEEVRLEEEKKQEEEKPTEVEPKKENLNTEEEKDRPRRN